MISENQSKVNHITPGTKALWRNVGPDLPITILGIMDVRDGVTWYSTAEYTGGTPENQIVLDMGDDDDLLDSFKMPDELEADQEQDAIDQRKTTLDNLIMAIGGVSVASTFVAAEEKMRLLRALVPMAKEIELNAQEVDKVREALTSFGWDDTSQIGFLESCELVPPPPKFKPLSLSELLEMPPKEWLIDQVLGAGDIIMIYGAPGCGKTFVEIDMIFAATLGRPWAMRFDIPRRLNVAYAAGEGISGLPSRFAAAAAFYGEDDIPNFTFFATTPQLYTGDDSPWSNSIIEFVKEWKARQDKGEAEPLDILIIDTLHSATAGADENSAKDMGIVLKLAKDAAIELGCAVVLVHHTNKNGTAERGSSALRGAMDCMIEIRRLSDTDAGTKALMHCAKLKDGEAWKDQTLDLIQSGEVDSVRVWWDPVSDGAFNSKSDECRKKMLAFMESQPGKKFTAKILAEVAGTSQSSSIKILAKMVTDKECVSELMDTTKQSSNRNPLTYKSNPS